MFPFPRASGIIALVKSMGSGRTRAYPWLVLISCCLLQGAGLGIINNCAGVFYVPVMQSFGCTMAGISLYLTFNNVFQCISTLFVTRMIRKVKVKYLVPIAGIIVGSAQISLSFSNSLLHWYIVGIIQGLAIAYVSGIIVPLVVANWFTERTGLAMGMTSMSAGLFGAVLSAVFGSMISAVSWRFAIMVSGIAILVMTVPMPWLFLAIEPEEKLCEPFGGFKEIPGEEKVGTGRVKLDLRVLAILMVSFCVSFSTIFNNYLPAFGEMTHIVLVAPAILLSINMFGNMGFKLGFGSLNDYIGAKRTTLVSFLILGIATAMLLLERDITSCIAAFFLGINAMISTTQGPLMAKDVWRRNEYPVVLQIVQIATRLSYAMFSYVEGALFDLWGSYRPLIMLQLAVAAMGAFFVVVLFSAKKRAMAA